MSTRLYENIKAHLDASSVEYTETTHEPVFTSEQASQISENEQDEGSKSLVIKTKSGLLAVVTVTGGQRVDFKQLKHLLGEKVSMCSPELLAEKLGAQLGGVAPFGYGADVRLIVSERLLGQERIFINPGRNDVTFEIAGRAFTRVMKELGAMTLKEHTE
jgi:Ala-tRNA(Pro) deacylase